MDRKSVEDYFNKVKLGEQTSVDYEVINDTCFTCISKQRLKTQKEMDNEPILAQLRKEYTSANQERKAEILIEVEKIKNPLKKSAGLYPVKVEEELDNEFRKSVEQALL